MPAKVKSAATLAKEAADAAAATGGLQEDSFEDAEDDIAPGISKDLLAYMKMQEKIRKEEMIRQDKIRQEERAYADMLRRDDLERMETERHQVQKAHDLQIRMLTEQLAKNSEQSSGKSAAKMPIFDLENDADTFPLWLSRWTLFVKGNKFDLIKNVEERNTRIMMELTASLSDATLSWLISKGFSEQELDDPKFILKALEQKIAKSSNPLIHQVELSQIIQFQSESTDKLVQRIQEKARKCEFRSVRDINDHQCLITLITAVSPEIRKKLFLAKVDTFDKAVEIVRAEEQARSDSKACSKSSESAEGNVMSGYKKDQRATRAAEGSTSTFSKHDGPPKPGYTCIRCMEKGHWASDCQYKYKECPSCKMMGHIAKTCKDRNWVPISGGQAHSIKAYNVADMAAISASHQLCAEHNARVEAYGSAFGPGEGNLDTL